MNAYTNFAFIDGLGGAEVLMIAFIALLLFGGKNLPSLARTMGRTLREFKNASNEVQREIRKAIDDAPDPDRPAQPVSTIAQRQAMPTQPPMPAELGLVDSGYDGAGENSAPCSPPGPPASPAQVQPPVSLTEPSAPTARPAPSAGQAPRRPIEPSDL